MSRPFFASPFGSPGAWCCTPEGVVCEEGVEDGVERGARYKMNWTSRLLSPHLLSTWKEMPLGRGNREAVTENESEGRWGKMIIKKGSAK